MKRFKLLYIGALCLVLNACQKSKPFSAEDISVSWEMGENNYQDKGQFVSHFTIVNKSDHNLTGSNWNLYFNFPRSIKGETITAPVKVRHVNGDFFELSPAENFTILKGDSLNVEFVSSDWAINTSDAPAGLYLVTLTPDGQENKPQVVDYSIRPFANEKQSLRAPGDKIPVANAAVSFQNYKSSNAISAVEMQPLVPAPVRFTKNSGSFTLTKSASVTADAGLENEQSFLYAVLNERLGDVTATSDQKKITLKLGNISDNGKLLTKGSEAYKLEISPSGVIITGADAEGVFYGIQTLQALMPAEAYKSKVNEIKLDAATVVDYPGFHYRGLHLDVARNFQTTEAVKKMLDLMAFYKLNKFHFHLSDDEGWRVEMKSLPELAEIGGYRGHDKSGKGMIPSFGSGPFADDKKSSGSGFYSEDDFIGILKYANARHIEVIPKIDIPGHARAAIKAMDARYEKLKNRENTVAASQYLLRDLQDSSQYTSVQGWNDNVVCICQESTYNFIATVVNDFIKLYEKADVPFYTFHIGADEVPHGVWEKSPACSELMKTKNIGKGDLTHYFFGRVSEILEQRNLNMGGWEEIALKKVTNGKETSLEANADFANSNFRPYVWNSVWGWGQEDVGYKLANAGYKIVLGNVTNLYFDLAYEKHPDEPGYYWGEFVDTKKVFDFNPFDTYLNATIDKFGNPLDQGAISQKVKLTEKGKNNILGIQGQLWAENLKGQDVLEYMAFPKILALSERAWSPRPTWGAIKDSGARKSELDKSWSKFTATVGVRELPRLDYIFGGVNYRISPPGVSVTNGMMTANTEFAGMIIRYTIDGSEPDESSAVYTVPVNVAARSTVRLKTFTTAHRSSRTVSIVAD
jgi:hexosaminidase